MSIESNINYLEYEIESNKKRIASMEKYLEENPSISIYKRQINQNMYYYKKYRTAGKSVSKYMGKGNDSVQELLAEIEAQNTKRKRIKENCKNLKKNTVAMEKQLTIARRVYLND